MIQTTLFPDTFTLKTKPVVLFSNDDIAYVFEQVADLLEAQGDDYYRIRAYREGGEFIRQLKRSAIEIYAAEGTAGLEQLPHIGQRLALSIQELATTGELRLLERLLIEVSPEDLFTTVPGIGQLLARRIYRALGIHTLEALEQAAYDGTLGHIEGFGKGRVQLVRDALGTMLGRSSQRRVRARQWQQEPAAQTSIAETSIAETSIATTSVATTSIPNPSTQPLAAQPSVELLLQVDEQYRYLAGAGQLRLVTPRRFNPEGQRWLPVMRLDKEGWSFNVLYSNTARAHELGKTHDWVVIYYEPAYQPADQRPGRQGQCTIVTETRGSLRGQRVIRGMAAAAA
jgi:Helix-hairpin-helix domain